MDRQIIYKRTKVARLQRLLTNCYSMDAVENCKEMWSQGDEFIFSYEDHGVGRLVYFAKTWDSVDRLLEKVENGRYFLEFMIRNPEEYIPDNSMQVAAMLRLANPDCRNVFEPHSQVIKFKDAVAVETAVERDAEEINNILWSTFQTEISHLLSDEELREKIKAGQICIHRDDDNYIDALLQADVMPKKFYINQVVNKGNREVIHAILLNRLEEYIGGGGKYLYAWVEDKNIASIKFHEKYGMTHDGMWSMIYSIER